jgi:hypothetical protein
MMVFNHRVCIFGPWSLDLQDLAFDRRPCCLKVLTHLTTSCSYPHPSRRLPQAHSPTAKPHSLFRAYDDHGDQLSQRKKSFREEFSALVKAEEHKLSERPLSS